MLPHVLLTGEAGHGKDTMCDRMISHHGYSRIGFADGVKDETCSRYLGSPINITRDYLNERSIKELPQASLALKYCSDAAYVEIALRAFESEDRELFAMTVTKFGGISGYSQAESFVLDVRMELPRSSRRITQVYGTEYRRTAPNGYAAYWIDRLQVKMESLHTPHAIADGRFPNEVALAEKINIPRIHVVRPSFGELKGVQASTHESENIPPPDAQTIILLNDGDLASIHAKVDHAVELLKQGASYVAIKAEMAGWTPAAQQVDLNLRPRARTSL
jgi:hypothetical protein